MQGIAHRVDQGSEKHLTAENAEGSQGTPSKDLPQSTRRLRKMRKEQSKTRGREGDTKEIGLGGNDATRLIPDEGTICSEGELFILNRPEPAGSLAVLTRHETQFHHRN